MEVSATSGSASSARGKARFENAFWFPSVLSQAELAADPCVPYHRTWPSGWAEVDKTGHRLTSSSAGDAPSAARRGLRNK